MLRSMYSGISGLRNFQTKLDVIGNNISNVNTYGFKKGRTVFKDLISQTVAGASAATETRGGVNSKQVGLGSQIAAIDTIHSGGSTQFTGNTLDLAISGDGFFQVSTASTDLNNLDEDEFTSDPLYTRAGNFYMDSRGYLVNSDGMYLVGYSATPENQDTEGILIDEDFEAEDYRDPDNRKPIIIPTTAKSMSIGQDGTVTFVNAAGELRWAGQLLMAKFPNPGGLEKVGGNNFQVTSNSGDAVEGIATTAGIGKVESGFLEMSNVDLSEEFTEMIVAQRGFQANTRIITTSDEILQELVNLKR
ncbi:flagellar basal body rod protein FlgG [Sporosarcina sp. 179-K 3D1 HS]|uniref:flagellar basal body rod protein FlgG n=1 Tax=Sporosarcina sp. 179-K 3D1 HS TaxID=3232169 RepID=UPI00399F902B